MKEQTNSGDTEDPGFSDLPATSELLPSSWRVPKRIFCLMCKNPSTRSMQTSNMWSLRPRVHKLKKTSEANTDTTVATKIENFIQPKPSDLGEGSSGDSFKSLAEEEFSVAEKTAPAIDSNIL